MMRVGGRGRKVDIQASTIFFVCKEQWWVRCREKSAEAYMRAV
jgi:hypothetical protein